MEQPGRVFTRDQLLDHAWQDPGAVTDRTVDAHIKSIRAKLRAACAGAENLIETRRGLGLLAGNRTPSKSASRIICFQLS